MGVYRPPKLRLRRGRSRPRMPRSSQDRFSGFVTLSQITFSNFSQGDTAGVALGSAASATPQQPEDAARRMEFMLILLAPMKPKHKPPMQEQTMSRVEQLRT